MSTRFGVIGVGKIGSALARALRLQGHETRVSNSRGPASLKEFADEIGVIPATTEDVLLHSDVIFITLHQKAIASLPKEIITQLSPDVIIVDVGSYIAFIDGPIKELDDGETDSVWVSRQLNRPVLKAFTNIFHDVLLKEGLPAGHADRIALPVFGANVEHKKVVFDLMNSFGFDGVDGGDLSVSWKIQPGSVLFCSDHNRSEVVRLLSVIKNEARIRFAENFPRFIAAGFSDEMPIADKRAWLRTANEESFEDILARYNESLKV